MKSDTFVEASMDSELLSELSVYNKKMVSENPNTKLSLRDLAIIGADTIAGYEGCKIGGEAGMTIGGFVGHPVSGAIIGGIGCGLICGIGASYLAYCQFANCEDVPQDDDLCNYLINSYDEYFPRIDEIRNNYIKSVPAAQSLLLPEEALSVGAAHNFILQDMQDGAMLRQKQTISHSENETVETALNTAIINDAQVRSFCKSYFAGVNSNQPYNNVSLSRKVMDIYYDLLQGTSFSEDDMADYINHYFTVVSSSNEISEEDKEALYTGLAVSLFSYNYWKEHGMCE